LNRQRAQRNVGEHAKRKRGVLLERAFRAGTDRLAHRCVEPRVGRSVNDGHGSVLLDGLADVLPQVDADAAEFIAAFTGRGA
jgi:hypothetical protein